MNRADIAYYLRAAWHRIVHPRDKLDYEGWVNREPYVLRLHLTDGPLAGHHLDLHHQKGDQVGFGPFIDLAAKDFGVAGTVYRYRRHNKPHPSVWYDAPGADTHIDLHLDTHESA